MAPAYEVWTPGSDKQALLQPSILVAMFDGEIERCKEMKVSKLLPKQMGVSKNRGTPKWMVYNGKPY